MTAHAMAREKPSDAPASLDALWQPIQIGTSLTLPHRVIQTAHEHNWGAPDFLLGDRDIRYWEDRARGGVALIITGAQTVHRSAFGHSPMGAEAWRPESEGRYRKLAEAVHKYGTKVIVQLGHWGAEDVGNQHLWNFRELWAPSDVPSPASGEIPRPLEKSDMEELVQGYVDSARNAQRAGVDGVEFHAAHGYLGFQFLSPLFNRREDEYGGSTENRCRFILEAVSAMREACGPDFAIGIRFSFDELNPTGAGIDVEEGERVVRVLNASGLFDYFNITGGAGYGAHHFIASMTSEYREQFVPYAHRVKQIVDVPVFTAGRVTDIRRAAALVAEGKVDVVGMTRAHIADPEIVVKARSGRLDEIRECAGINQGCINRVFLGKEMSCTQNPAVGREAAWGLGTLAKAERPRRVMVVGAGPAGLKVAEVAAARGHEVRIYERADAVGGQLRYASRLPHRSEWRTVVGTLERTLARAGVEVRTGVEVTGELIEIENPDAVVLATGSRFDDTGWSPARAERPGIPGLGSLPTLTPAEALDDPERAGDDILIVEEVGSYAALGLAEFFADRGKRVRVVSRNLAVGDKLGASLDLPWAYSRTRAKGVILQPQTFVEQLNADGTAELSDIWVGGRETVPASSIVLVMGRKSNSGLYQSLADSRCEVHRVGDCLAPRDVDMAFYDGERVGREV